MAISLGWQWRKDASLGVVLDFDDGDEGVPLRVHSGSVIRVLEGAGVDIYACFVCTIIYTWLVDIELEATERDPLVVE